MSTPSSTYFSQGSFAPLCFSSPKAAIQQLLTRFPKNAKCVTLRHLTDHLWRVPGHDEDRHSKQIGPWVVLIEATTSSAPVTISRARAAEVWNNLVVPQSTAKQAVVMPPSWPSQLISCATDAQPFQGQPIHVLHVTSISKVMSTLFDSADTEVLWGAFDLLRLAMWTPLQLEYDRQLSLLLEKAPDFMRFWHDLEKLEGERLYRFGGCLRDILSGHVASSGDTYFSFESKMSGGGDVDMYVHAFEDETALPGMGVSNKEGGGPFKLVAGTKTSSGSTRTYVAGTDSLGPQPSRYGKKLFVRRYAHWEGVLFAYEDNGYRVRCDTFFRATGTDASYFEHELNACDFDVNRLVEWRGMLQLRAFVRSDCPWQEEEREHHRLLQCFRSKTFGFAHTRNPKRANPTDSRLLCRLLHMATLKTWAPDVSDEDNLRCVGSLWIHLFTTVLDGNHQDSDSLLSTPDWSKFFHATGAQLRPNTAQLTRHWTTSTGDALSVWLQHQLGSVHSAQCYDRSRPMEAFFALTWQYWIQIASLCKSSALWQTVVHLWMQRRHPDIPYQQLDDGQIFADYIINAEDMQVGNPLCGCKCDQDNYRVASCRSWAKQYFQWSSLRIVHREEARQRETELNASLTLLQEGKSITHQSSEDEDDEYYASRHSKPASKETKIRRLYKQLDNLWYPDESDHNHWGFSIPSPLRTLRQSVLRGMLDRNAPKFRAWIEQQGLWTALLQQYRGDIDTQLQLSLVLGDIAFYESQWNALVRDSDEWLRNILVTRLQHELQKLSSRHSGVELDLTWHHRSEERTMQEAIIREATNDDSSHRSGTSGAARRRESARQKRVHALRASNQLELQTLKDAHALEQNAIEHQIADAQSGHMATSAMPRTPLILKRDWFLMLTTSSYTTPALIDRALQIYDDTFGGPGSFSREHREFLGGQQIRLYDSEDKHVMVRTLMEAPVDQLPEIVETLVRRECVYVDDMQAWDMFRSSESLKLEKLIARSPHKVLLALLQIPFKRATKITLIRSLCHNQPKLVEFYSRAAFPSGRVVDKTELDASRVAEDCICSRFSNSAYELNKLVAQGVVHPDDGLTITGTGSGYSSYYDRCDQLLFDRAPMQFAQLAWFCGNNNTPRLYDWLVHAYNARVKQSGRYGGHDAMLHFHVAFVGVLARHFTVTELHLCLHIQSFLSTQELRRLI